MTQESYLQALDEVEQLSSTLQYSFHIVDFLTERGLALNEFARLRPQIKSERIRSLLLVSLIAHISKEDLYQRLAKLSVPNDPDEEKKIVASHYNLLLGRLPHSNFFWDEEFKEKLLLQFPDCLTLSELELDYHLYSWVSFYQLMRYVSRLFGWNISWKKQTFLLSNSNSNLLFLEQRRRKVEGVLEKIEPLDIFSPGEEFQNPVNWGDVQALTSAKNESPEIVKDDWELIAHSPEENKFVVPPPALNQSSIFGTTSWIDSPPIGKWIDSFFKKAAGPSQKK